MVLEMSDTTSTSEERDNILVIKLGALGDFVLAMGPFQAIRRHAPDAHIVLLTTKPFKELAEKSGWFDEVWIDERPRVRQIRKWRTLRKKLRAGRFSMVFDLQTSDRSSFYFRLFWPDTPLWSGIARGCSHPHANPERNFMHTIERQRDQLAMAGISSVPFPDVAWMDADVSRFGLPDSFALFIPGGAPHRPKKRWPAERFGELAVRIAKRGITPVVIGTKDEAQAAETIQAKCPEAISLIGKTSLFDLAALARRARFAVGNDTGPMHLAAITGCATRVLYSNASDPALCGQRGHDVRIIRVEDLNDLGVDAVDAAVTVQVH